MKDLQSWIAWVAELALLLKLTAVYLAWLYLGYVFAAYISFIYRFGKVFGAMEKSGEKLSSFISREDGLLDDWWRTELRPNLVDLSHEVNSSIMLRPENDALVEFAEARLGLGGDMQRAMGILWDLGVRGGGRPLTWEDIVTPRIVEAVVQVDEKVQDSLCLVLETLCDYEGRTDLGHILEEGAKGKLLNILKKATWHDRLDKAKKSKAKKRQSTVIPFSQLVKSLGDASEELTPEELASRIAEIDPDAAYGAIDAKLTLGQLAQSPDLTDREREAFLLAVALAEANGEVSTYQEIGRHMGVTKGTAKKLLDRAYEKLRKHALRD
jgi:RNA polymerase sigma factor (sigma-70 family)